MNDLIEALQIFAKYIPNEKYPTWCEHDALHVSCNSEMVSDNDKMILASLSFRPDNFLGFMSSRFGNC